MVYCTKYIWSALDRIDAQLATKIHSSNDVSGHPWSYHTPKYNKKTNK